MEHIDLEAIRKQLNQGLPQQVRWQIEDDPWDLDFSRTAAPLQSLAESENVGTVEDDLRNLWIFGQDDYAESGSATCEYVIDGANGKIFCLETEMATLVPWNTDAGRFIESFAVVDKLIRLQEFTPAAASEAVRAIDPEVYESSRWCDVLAHLTELAEAQE